MGYTVSIKKDDRVIFEVVDTTENKFTIDQNIEYTADVGISVWEDGQKIFPSPGCELLTSKREETVISSYEYHNNTEYEETQRYNLILEYIDIEEIHGFF